ncbi:protein Abitram-like isoform X2 [Panulirus ornatus]|uniref:protein Abitram-like isoform X2 n=1 Tax=Panulirus ornatus TaxID=150431 RepID=UPI003A8842DC
MHPDLSPHLHTDECNALISKLHTCHEENKFLKFLGACNELDTAMLKCLKAEISYDVGRFNRLENQVSGKGKRGAQQLGPQSPICIITCSDSTKYTVLAGIHGKLVEVNERLVSHPHLLSESPNAEGYLALVLPPLRNGDFMRSKLFTEEDYKKLGLYSSSE